MLACEEQDSAWAEGAYGLNAPARFSAIRLIDDPSTGTHHAETPEADVDAVELLRRLGSEPKFELELSSRGGNGLGPRFCLGFGGTGRPPVLLC